MRLAAIATLSLLAIAACNPSGGEAADAGGAPPSLTGAAYRAEGVIAREGQSLPIVVFRDGAKQRMEVGGAVIITDADTGESLMITTAAGRTMALRMDADQVSDPTQSWLRGLRSGATRTGACSAAGESGEEWTRTEAGKTKTACVTQDGIVLAVTEGGERVWDITSVSRGPQPAELFAPPPGVEVTDLGGISGVGDMIERARGAGN